MVSRFVQKKEVWNEGLFFLARMGIITLIFYFVFSLVEIQLQIMESAHVQLILNSVGVFPSPAELPYQFWVNGKLIEISALCSGLVEFALLSGAILATKTESLHKRIKGVLIGIILLYIFNLLRIVFTVLQIEHTNFSFAEFTHDVLFRFVLIVGFALLYAGWLNVERVKAWLAIKNML